MGELFDEGDVVVEVVFCDEVGHFFLVAPRATSDEGEGCFWVIFEDGGEGFEEEDGSFSFCVWSGEEDFSAVVFVG